jgi:histone deacetylase complex regulatory component SIN3
MVHEIFMRIKKTLENSAIYYFFVKLVIDLFNNECIEFRELQNRLAVQLLSHDR